MEHKSLSYVYGLVPSRRLGRSLGIDLVPYKVCSYDCSYCQLGHTTELTIERKEYMPINAVLDDLDVAVSNKKMIDRRPCTIEDISAGLDMNRLELVKIIEGLIKSNKIVEQRIDTRIYFSTIKDRGHERISNYQR